MNHGERVAKKVNDIATMTKNLIPGATAREGQLILIVHELLDVCLSLQLQVNGLTIVNMQKEKAEIHAAIEEEAKKLRN